MANYYYWTKTISTTDSDGTNVVDFQRAFGGSNASYFKITNDDSTYAVYFLIGSDPAGGLECYPTIKDIEVKAGETWTSRDTGGSYAGIRLVADTSSSGVAVRIYAEK